MKITKPLLLPLFSFLLFCVLDAHTQQVREMQPLEKHDFECLQSLDCVQSSQSLKSKGWLFIFDETVDEFAPELTARMEGENISLLSIYDNEGNMIKSKYKRRNVALPTSLLRYLTEGNYEEWKITGSEMVMNDFDPSSARYLVMLEKNSSVISEVFDSEFINGLHLKYQSLVKQTLQ